MFEELRKYQIELELQNEELRSSQEELLASRDGYTDLYDFSPVGHVTVNNAGIIIEANLTLATMLGLERRYLMRTLFSDAVVEEDQDTYHHHRRELLDTRRRGICELRLRRGGGSVLWVQLAGIAVNAPDGSGDSDDQLRLAVIDITQRKESEVELARYREQLEEMVRARTDKIEFQRERLVEKAAFVANNPAPVLRVDQNGTILDMNPAASLLLGEVLVGQPVRERLPALEEVLLGSSRFAWPLQFEDVMGDKSFLFTVRYDASTDSYYVYGSDITERRALEKLVIEAGDTQCRRIGRDLHDTLGQNLTGLSFLIHGLARELSNKSPEQAELADKIVQQVNDSISQVRFLAKGLTPVGLGEDGLAAALGELAADTESLFGVSCVFHCDQPVAFDDESVSTQVYHIALEAVNNATKHAHADHITIMLASDERDVRVVVSDDGVGLGCNSAGSGGMGMHTMRHRAGVIGALLRIDSGDSGGVTVICTRPMALPTGCEDHNER